MGYGYYPGYTQYPQMYQPMSQQFAPVQPASGQNMSPAQMSGTSQDERIWVQGEGAAQAYLVAPNSFVRLWDSQQPVFYEKRADQTGKPYMETFEYKRRGCDIPMNGAPESKPSIDYGNEIRALQERVEALEKGARADEQTK